MIKLKDILNEVRTLASSNNQTVIYGFRHNSSTDIKAALTHIKKTFPKDTEKIAFLGEGGDKDNNYPAGSEGEIIYRELQNYFTNTILNDSWDGLAFDVTNPSAPMYNMLQSATGLPKYVVQGSIFTAMVGQGQDASELVRLLGESVASWLRNLGITKPTNPTGADRQRMYDLSFPEDTGGPQQEVSKVVQAYNELRDANLIKKIHKYESQGYRVIALAGESHLDLIGSI